LEEPAGSVTTPDFDLADQPDIPVDKGDQNTHKTPTAAGEDPTVDGLVHKSTSGRRAVVACNTQLLLATYGGIHCFDLKFSLLLPKQDDDG